MIILERERRNPAPPERVITRCAAAAVLPDFSELWRERHLVAVLVWRDLNVRFSHTVLGILWYVLQPALLMLVITVGFRFVMPADVGGMPYPIFVASGLVVWQYFANAFSAGATSFEKFHGVISKVYIPRLALPLACIAAALADMLAASLLLVPLMVYYQIIPSWRIVLVPGVVGGIMLFVAGLALALSVACAKYRDLRHVLPFASQLFFFASPIFFAHAVLPPRLQTLLGINPLAGYVDAFRWALFPHAHPPRPTRLLVAVAVSGAIFLAGLFYFQRSEGDVVDIL
jgi:lipopolysaccharide transport system permease protein